MLSIIKSSKGFTLLELLISLSIISILASISIPSFILYMDRAKISEALGFAGACRTAITEASQSGLATVPVANGFSCSEGVNGIGKFIQKIETDTSGKIYVFLRGINPLLDGSIIEIHPFTDAGKTIPAVQSDFSAGTSKAIIAWRCVPATSNGPPSKYLPANCR